MIAPSYRYLFSTSHESSLPTVNGAFNLPKYSNASSLEASSSNVFLLFASGNNAGLNLYDSNGGYLILSSTTSLGIISPYVKINFAPAFNANFLNAGTFFNKAIPSGTGFSISPTSLINSTISGLAKELK
jgi:hypothetical protein